MDKSDDKAFLQELVANSETMTIVGVVQPRADASSTILPIGVAYTHALTYYAIDHAAESEVVKQQLADPEVNVLTGERFDADQRETDLDISSLFSVDTDMLKDAFQFDASKLQFDLSGAFDLQDGSFDFSSILDPSAFQLDLSDLDLSDIDMSDVELPDMDALDLSQLFADMDLSVSEDALQSLMKKIMNGYKRYIISNGILNLDKIGFSSYMESDQFKQLLSESMGDLLDTTGLQEQFTASLQQNLQGIMTSYLQSYSEQLSQKLGEALQTKLTAAIQTQMSTVMQQLMTQLTTQFSQQIQSAIQNNIAQLSSQVGRCPEDRPHRVPECRAGEHEHRRPCGSGQDEPAVQHHLLQQCSWCTGLFGLCQARQSSGSTPRALRPRTVIVDSLNAYNAAMRAQGEEDKVIVFSDTVGTLMSAVTRIRGHGQQCAGGLCGYLAGGVLHHDRRHHLYQRAGAPQGDRHSARHRCLQAQRLAGVQRRDLYHRPVFRRDGRGALPAAAHPRQYAHPPHRGRCERGSLAAAAGCADPDRSGHPAYHAGRPDPRPQRRKEQPCQSAAL